MNESEARILLVDDEPDIRTQIASALAGNDYQIDEFGDVQSATDAINKARSAGWEYDAAILDFRLPVTPLDRGTPVDESLCKMLTGRSLVWHITAYLTDDEIARQIRECHSADEAPRAIAKGVGFCAELERQVKQALASRRIKASMAMLRSGSSESGYSRRFRPDSAAVSATNLHARLCGDIKVYWKDLHPNFRDELRDLFDIQFDTEGRVISVFSK